MKPVFTLPLILLVAGSALAQHGSVSGHAAAAPSAPPRSFSMASPGPIRTVNSAPTYRANWQSPQYGARYTSPIGPPPFGGTQPVSGRRYPYPVSGRRSYYSPYYSTGAYLSPGYLGYGYGYSDDSSYASSYADQSQAGGPAYPDANAQAQPPDIGYDQPQRPAYDPQAGAYPNQPSAPPADQPEITLLFKDGRPSQQIQNYAVTQSTLYVLDGVKRREIPLDDIDLPQTEKTNRDAGVDFEIPAGAE